MNEVLSPQELAQFEEHGWLKLPQAFPREVALQGQEVMWAQLKALHGVERDRRETWSTAWPGSGMNAIADDAVFDGVASARLSGAVRQLLGREQAMPKSWGGFLISFPSGESREKWRLASENWHWDGNPSEHLSQPNGLFVFTLYSDIAPRGGGTLLLSGSHRLVNAFFEALPLGANRNKQAPLKKGFSQLHPYLAELIGFAPNAGERTRRFMDESAEVDGVPVRVVEVAGDAGDAFVCHPSVFHAVSQNCADMPRFMRVKGLTRTKVAS